MEEWRQLQDYPGYEVSSEGRVRSLNGTRGNPRQEPLLLTPRPNNCEYIQYRLSKDNKVYVLFAHRLVGQAFIPNPENKLTIDHLNHNRSDNRVTNLSWATYTEQSINRRYNAGSSGERCIEATESGKYRVCISRKDLTYKSSVFDTLDEAIKDRDRVLGL